MQTEFGAFVSLATIRARGGSGGRATGGPGCWRVLKERLSGLEALFHEAQVCLWYAYAPAILLSCSCLCSVGIDISGAKTRSESSHTCRYLVFTRPCSLIHEVRLWQAVPEAVSPQLGTYFEQKQGTLCPWNGSTPPSPEGSRSARVEVRVMLFSTWFSWVPGSVFPRPRR